MWTALILLSLSISPTFSIISIDDFGAVPNDNSTNVALNNRNAIINALKAANASQAQENRTVLLPAGNTYYFFNVSIANLYNVTLRIDGTYAVSNDIGMWVQILNQTGTLQNFPSDHPACLLITDSIDFELTGNGILDGQGHDWWYDFFNHVPSRDFRPYLFRMIHSKDTEIHNIHFKNSPFWTMDFIDMLNMHMHDFDIYVDFSAQQALANKSVWNWSGDFPANTDGMDLRGKNILVENAVIEVGDDGIAIKPSNGWGKYTNCSQDMLIRNITTVFTEGMAIGSIGPDPKVNCIRNITFENIHHTYGPFRGINVKTNNIGTGSGIVDNIVVRNMTGYNAMSTFIYFGPMSQGPNINGSRCDNMWPKQSNTTCNTNPLVSISNVLIENTNCQNCHGWLPGIIWCDPTNPCKNLTFVNAQIQGSYSISNDYWCQNAQGTQQNTNLVNSSCLTVVGNQGTTPTTPTTPTTQPSVKTCPSGWYNSTTNPNKCIHFSSQVRVITEGYAECYVMDSRSTLLGIDSAFENSEINQKIPSGCSSFYLGLTRTNTTWGWQSGENATYTNWDSGYPNAGVSNNCAIMKLSDGKWQNTMCNNYLCYACQLLI